MHARRSADAGAAGLLLLARICWQERSRRSAMTCAGTKPETNVKTLICLILDRSGSMSGRESDVINGANGFIDKQKALPDPSSIALVRFDSEGIERFRAMAPLAECAPITEEDYQ